MDWVDKLMRFLIISFVYLTRDISQWNPFIMLTRSEKLFSVKLVFGVFGICFVYDFLRTKKLIFFGFFILKRAFSEQSSEVFIDQ